MARREEPTDTNQSDANALGGAVEHDWHPSGRPSTAVVEAVAAVTDRKPTDLPPLHGYVDGDALDALVTSRAGGDGTSIRVSFAYEGVDVTVDSDDGITVRPAAVEGG